MHLCPACSQPLRHRQSTRCTNCGAVLRIGNRVFAAHVVARLAGHLASTGCSWDAAEFVIRGFRVVRSQQRGRLQARASLATAELWRGLLDHARHRFGSTAADALESFGLRQGKDFTRVVFALVGAGYLKADDSDYVDSFDQLPDTRVALEIDEPVDRTADATHL